MSPRISAARFDLRGDLGFGRPLQLERERHVVGDRHVRVERVVLEHHGDIALLGRNVVDHPVADADLAARDVLQPRHHAQQRRLAAAGRTHEDHELPVLNVHRHPMDDLRRPISLLDVANLNCGH